MNANPPTAAAQTREQYRDVTTQLGNIGLDTAIPEGVRDVAEKDCGAHSRGL